MSAYLPIVELNNLVLPRKSGSAEGSSAEPLLRLDLVMWIVAMLRSPPTLAGVPSFTYLLFWQAA